MLELERHQAVVVGDGCSGLRLAATGQFDLILLDMVMPGESGISVLLGLQEKGISTPVVVTDGLLNERIKRRAAELGAADFLNKPVGVYQLRTLLAAFNGH